MSIFMRMFGPKPGTWGVYSESDPRFRASGDCTGLICDGSGVAPAVEWANKRAKELGMDKPPSDCKISFHKG